MKELFRTTLQDGISALAWSPDNRSLAIGSYAGECMQWGIEEGKVLVQVPGAHFMGTQSLVWSSDSTRLISGGCDSRVRFWRRGSDKQEGEFSFKNGWVTHLLCREFEKGLQKQDYLIATAGKKMVCLDLNGGLNHAYPDHPFAIEDLSWRPRHAQFTASNQGGVTLWSVMKENLEKTYEWKNPALFHRWSPDGKWIAAGGQDGSVHLWIAKNSVDFHMGGYSRKVERLDWHHQSRWLATPNGENLAVWDCSLPGPDGRVPQEYAWHEKNIVSLAYQPEGDLLATGGEEGNVAFWMPEKRDFPVGKLALKSSVQQMAWSPDGKWIALGTQLGELFVFGI